MAKCDFNCNFIEIVLRHGCSPVNLLHIFRTPILKNTSGRLLLKGTSLKFKFTSIYWCAGFFNNLATDDNWS